MTPLHLHVDLPLDLMDDQVTVLARDGVVRDGDLLPTGHRVVARFVPCLIAADGRSRLPSELVALAGITTSRVLMGPTPKVQEGYVLEEVSTRTRYVVRRVEFFPSEHAAQFQVIAVDKDLIGEVRPT